MSKFSHLSALKVDASKLVRFTLGDITVNGVSPTLLLAPATEANKPYYNAVLKRVATAKKRSRHSAVTMAFIDESREADIAEYAQYIVKGWEDMLDNKGNPIEFSKEECLEFLEAIDSWLFDQIRAFCVDPTNFSGVVNIEVGDTAKN